MPFQSWVGALVTAQGDGAALTAAARASCLPPAARFTIPANFLQYVGQALRVKAAGRISSVITTPGTARFDVAFGAAVVADSQAIVLDPNAAYTNVGWYLEMLLTVRSIGNGTNATLMQSGIWVSTNIAGQAATPPKGALTAILPWNTPPVVGAGFDSTVANAVDLFFTQTVATGSLQLHQYTLEALN